MRYRRRCFTGWSSFARRTAFSFRPLTSASAFAEAMARQGGVSSEAGLDHRTMRICFDELRRAQEILSQRKQILASKKLTENEEFKLAQFMS